MISDVVYTGLERMIIAVVGTFVIGAIDNLF